MSIYTSKERQAQLDEIAKNGRPDKFTPEIRNAILHSISRRIPYEYAAEANGIGERLLYKWLEHGLEDINAGIDSDYARFRQDLKRIEHDKMADHLDEVSSKPERWQADAWVLERRWSKGFGQNAAMKELAEQIEEIKDILAKGKDNAASNCS